MGSALFNGGDERSSNDARGNFPLFVETLYSIRMRRFIRGLLRWFWRLTIPKPNPELKDAEERIRLLESRLTPETPAEQYRRDYTERLAELIEARQMAGSGPWRTSPATLQQTDAVITEGLRRLQESVTPVALREDVTNPILTAGAYGDIELALQNVDWRREVNLSWLEFSRWGIQQIILISRLNYIKNPIIRRLIDISAIYVFGRGVEVSSSDDDANAILREFFDRNRSVLGQVALTDLQRRKYYDGNLFFCFFSDLTDKGNLTVRVIDATEIQDIVCNPEDADEPWFYKREWTQRVMQDNGSTQVCAQTAWYPALNYDPTPRPETIGKDPVMWKSPIWHRKCGAVSKWHFGCPIIYPALDWAKMACRFLQACSTVKLALSTIAMTLTTKGGQQAMAGLKSQLQTTVGPSSTLWDQNPPPVNASIFAAGPGTQLSIFNKGQGGGGDPEECRQYKLQSCMVMGVPETFLSDVSTGNLATATTLDRPTELAFQSQQEEWREDLATIATYVLKVSKGAVNGKLRASLERRGAAVDAIVIMEARRVLEDGVLVYEKAAVVGGNEIDVRVTFPSIREGDIPALINATVAAMTLNNKGGQVVGIDEREGVRILGRLAGVEDVDEMIETMYPEDEYDPDRTKADLPAPVMPAMPAAGGEPQNPDGKQTGANLKPQTQEALKRLFEALKSYHGGSIATGDGSAASPEVANGAADRVHANGA